MMGKSPRLFIFMAVGGGAVLLAVAAVHYFWKDPKKRLVGKSTRATPPKSLPVTPEALPGPPELHHDPRAESETRDDIAQAQLISVGGSSDPSSASPVDSDTPGDDVLIYDEEVENLLCGEDDEGDVSRDDSFHVTLPENVSAQPGPIFSPDEARSLVSSLQRRDDAAWRVKCLVTVANAASFSANQYLLRRAGVIPVLNDLIGDDDYPDVQRQAMKALTNLAVNEENQDHMEESVGILVRLADSEENLDVQLAAMVSLVNLSVTNKFHETILTLAPRLMFNVENHARLGPLAIDVLTQTLKILVNLSSNSTSVPSLLALRPPSNLIDLLKRPDPTALRVCYFLSNVTDALNKDSYGLTPLNNDKSNNEDKYERDSLFALLASEEKCAQMRSFLLDLTRNEDDGVRQQSTRLYTGLFLYWGRKLSQNDVARKSSPI